MIVDLDELDKCFNYLETINDVPLEEIVWKRGDKKIEIAPEQFAEFKFIGLSNTCFPQMFDIENSLE